MGVDKGVAYQFYGLSEAERSGSRNVRLVKRELVLQGAGVRSSTLDALVSLIDWSPVAALLDPFYPALAWPSLAMFKGHASVDLVRPVRCEAGLGARRARLHSLLLRFYANEATPERDWPSSGFAGCWLRSSLTGHCLKP